MCVIVNRDPLSLGNFVAEAICLFKNHGLANGCEHNDAMSLKVRLFVLNAFLFLVLFTTYSLVLSNF